MALSRIVTHLLLVATIAAGTQLAACSGAKLARPSRTSADEVLQSDDRTIQATHPPPAALPEIVSPRPSERAQWLPGSWVWQRDSWVWERGGWIANPERLRLVDSQVRYAKDGTLEFCPRRWVNAEGEEMNAPPIVTPAGTPPTMELREEHTIP